MAHDCPVKQSAPDRQHAPQRHMQSSLAKGNHKGGKGNRKGKGKGKGAGDKHRTAVRGVEADDVGDEYFEELGDDYVPPAHVDPSDMA